MNSAIVTGKIISEIEIKNSATPNVVCRFNLTLGDRLFDCLVTGSKTHKFKYDVEKGMEVTIEAVFNDQMQLMVYGYTTHSYPNYFGQLFDSRGYALTQDKEYF